MYRPVLPPRAGYVEQEINGVATYIPVKETLKVLELQEEIKRKDAQIKTLSDHKDFLDDCTADTDAMLVDLEYRLTLLELGVN